MTTGASDEEGSRSDDGVERREDTRVDVGMPFVVVVDGKPQRCRVVNLSCSGARIARQKPPPDVHVVPLSFGDDTLRVLARTVWTAEDCYAVRFLALRDVDRLTIAEHVDDVLRR